MPSRTAKRPRSGCPDRPRSSTPPSYISQPLSLPSPAQTLTRFGRPACSQREEKRQLQQLLQQREVEQRERIAALRERWGDKDTEAVKRQQQRNAERAEAIRKEHRDIVRRLADQEAAMLETAQARREAGGTAVAIDARLDAAEAATAAARRAEAKEATRVRLEAQRAERERDAAHKASLADKVHGIHEAADRAGEDHFERQQQRALAARDEKRRFAALREAKEVERLRTARERRERMELQHRAAKAKAEAKAEARRETTRRDKEFDRLQERLLGRTLQP